MFLRTTKHDNTEKCQNSLITFHHYFNAKISFSEITVLFMEWKKCAHEHKSIEL